MQTQGQGAAQSTVHKHQELLETEPMLFHLNRNVNLEASERVTASGLSHLDGDAPLCACMCCCRWKTVHNTSAPTSPLREKQENCLKARFTSAGCGALAGSRPKAESLPMSVCVCVCVSRNHAIMQLV